MKQWIAVLVAYWFVANLTNATAQQPATLPKQSSNPGLHGGYIHVGDNHQFEVVFTSESIDVYVFDGSGKPISARNVRGNVSLAPSDDHRTHRHDLYPQAGDETDLVNCLHLATDLAGYPDGSIAVRIKLYGLARQAMTITTQLQRSTTREQLAIQRQRICPVSGKPLGSMGPPPKVTIGDRDVFVCCVGCTNALKANPDHYLARLSEQ